MTTKLAALANASPMVLLQGDLAIVAANMAKAQQALETATGGRQSWLDPVVAIANARAADALPGVSHAAVEHGDRPVKRKSFADAQQAVAMALQLALAGKSFAFKNTYAGSTIEVAEEDATALDAGPTPSFVLVQEGGSSSELYLHGHANADDADEDRYSCSEDGAYRTSPVVEVPAALTAMGEVFYAAVENILRASTGLECVDRPAMGLKG